MGFISLRSLVFSRTAVLNFSKECLTILPVSAVLSLCKKLWWAAAFAEDDDFVVVVLLFKAVVVVLR